VTDYETIQKKRNIIVGVFVLLGLMALIWLIYIFNELPTAISKIRSFQIYVQFPFAPGVQENTPVQFCGYQVGRVIDVLAPSVFKDLNTGKSYHQIKVVLAIYKKYRTIPSNVGIRLMRRGLGSSYIELEFDPNSPLVPKDPNRPETAFLVEGMLLQGSTGVANEFLSEGTQKKLEQLAVNLTELTSSANAIIGDEENRQNFRQFLTNITNMTKQATETLKEFQNFSATGTQTIQSVNVNLNNVSAAIVQTSEELTAATREFKLVLEKVNSGDGTAAKLLNDGRLYENLLDSADELEMVLKQLTLLLDDWQKNGVSIRQKLF